MSTDPQVRQLAERFGKECAMQLFDNYNFTAAQEIWISQVVAEKFAAFASHTRREALRWIPVEERLPEDRADVLAYSENDGIVLTRLEANGCGEFEAHADCGMEATHWQPLPEPPLSAYSQRRRSR